MNTELIKNHERIMAEFRALNIRPKMELTITGGKPKGTFDLRSLNQTIIKRTSLMCHREN